MPPEAGRINAVRHKIMSERDEYIAKTIMQHMTEPQKEQLFEVIKNYDAVRNKLAPIVIAGEQLHMLPSVKISFGFSGHLVLENQH